MACAEGDTGERNEETPAFGEQHPDARSGELLDECRDGEFLLRFTGDGRPNTFASVRVEEHLRGECVKAKRICFTRLTNDDVAAHGT